MKNKIIILFFCALALFITGCCENYCVAAGSTEIIEVTLYDKNTGDQIQDNTKLFFQFDSEVRNPSIFGRANMDLSIANKKGMEDVLTIKWIGCSFCVVAELAVEYELNGDSDCCDRRSVKVKNIESVCTNPNLEFIVVDGRVAEIGVLVEI